MDHAPAPDSPASSPKSFRVPAEAIRQFFSDPLLRELAEQSGTESLREGLELILALLLQPDPPPLNPTEVELVWRVIESGAPDEERALMLRDAAAAFAGRKSRIGPLYFEVPVLLLKKACLLHPSMLMEAELLSMVIYSGLAKAELFRVECPTFECNDRVTGLSRGALATWVASDAIERLAAQLSGSSCPASRWLDEDLQAAIAIIRARLLLLQQGHTYADRDLMEERKQRSEFITEMLDLWNAVLRELQGRPVDPRPSQAFPRGMGWHMSEQANVQTRVECSATQLAKEAEQTSRSTSPPPVRKAPPAGATPSAAGCQVPDKWHRIVLLDEIPPSGERADQETIKRYQALSEPLPLCKMPTVDELDQLRARLLGQMPWCAAIINELFDELVGQSVLGIPYVQMRPLLLVGPPGAGKSRLAQLIAKAFGMPWLMVPVAGTHDSKVLAGTSRGWASGAPSDVVQLLLMKRSASATVIVDEIDKVGRPGLNTGEVQNFLLGLLEPSTASGFVDAFLKARLDLRGISWILTANTLQMSQALLSRLRVRIVPEPPVEDFPVIVEGVLDDLAEEWQVARERLPAGRELEINFVGVGSARALRSAVIKAVLKVASERYLQ